MTIETACVIGASFAGGRPEYAGKTPRDLKAGR